MTRGGTRGRLGILVLAALGAAALLALLALLLGPRDDERSAGTEVGASHVDDAAAPRAETPSKRTAPAAALPDGAPAAPTSLELPAAAVARGAALEVELRDHQRAPLADGALRLFAVLDGGMRHALHVDGRRVATLRTDDRGRARFEQLETGVPLAVLSNDAKLRLILDDGEPHAPDDAPTWRADSQGPTLPALSPGDARPLGLLAIPSRFAGLSGRVVDARGRPLRGLSLELVHLDPPWNAEPRTLRWIVTDDDGVFRAPYRGAARLLLRTCALVDGVDVYALEREVQLEAATHHDFGTLVLGADSLHLVRVQARLDGDPVPFSALYDTPPRISLVLDALDDGPAVCGSLRDVPVETDLHLRGFESGRFSVRHTLAPVQGLRPEIGARRTRVESTLTLSGSAPAVAWIDFASMSSLRLRLTGGDAPGVSGSLRITLSGASRDHATGALVPLPVRADEPIDVRARSGAYRLIVEHLAPEPEVGADGVWRAPPPQVQLAAAADVTLGDDPVELPLELAPACMLRGLTKPPPLMGHGRATVRFELIGVETSPVTARSLVAVVNPDGSFVLGGLPPRTRFQRLRHPLQSFVTGEPGSVTDLGLIE